MKHFLLIISLALNGVLAAAIWTKSISSSPTENIQPPRTKVLTRTIVQEIEAPPETNSIPIAPAEPFHWSSIQSTNFVDYAEKLRDLGCPPQTVRDIVTGEINDWMLVQRRTLFAPYAARFWEFATRSRPGIPEELVEPVRNLKKLKAELLGAALDKFPKTDESKKPRRDETLEMITDEKKEKFQEIEKKYADLRKELQKDKQLKGADRNKRTQELDKQKEAERQAILSPEELAEYKIRRESWQFQNVYGFQTDEEEMRKIAAVHAKNPIWGNDPDIPADEEGRKARTKQRDEELKTVLGEKRFAEFKRVSDPVFASAFKVAQAYKLPEETAIGAYDIIHEFRAQAQTVHKNPSLTPEQIKETVQKLSDATEDAITELYGEKATRALRRMRAY